MVIQKPKSSELYEDSRRREDEHFIRVIVPSKLTFQKRINKQGKPEICLSPGEKCFKPCSKTSEYVYRATVPKQEDSEIFSTICIQKIEPNSPKQSKLHLPRFCRKSVKYNRLASGQDEGDDLPPNRGKRNYQQHHKCDIQRLFDTPCQSAQKVSCGIGRKSQNERLQNGQQIDHMDSHLSCNDECTLDKCCFCRRNEKPIKSGNDKKKKVSSYASSTVSGESIPTEIIHHVNQHIPNKNFQPETRQRSKIEAPRPANVPEPKNITCPRTKQITRKSNNVHIVDQHNNEKRLCAVSDNLWQLMDANGSLLPFGLSFTMKNNKEIVNTWLKVESGSICNSVQPTDKLGLARQVVGKRCNVNVPRDNLFKFDDSSFLKR